MICEKFKKEDLPYYIAIAYKINYKDDKMHEDEITLDDKEKPIFIRQKFPKEQNSFEEIETDDDMRLMFMPKICREDEQQRAVVYISGASGEGKSYLMNMYADLYHQYYPQNKIFYFTKNNASKDRSLDREKYTIIDVEKFLEKYSDEDEFDKFITDGKEWDNSLMIFDDIGALEKDKKADKIMWSFINILLENKRKNGINILIISHIPTNFKKTMLLIRETTTYVCFPSNLQVKSDRFLKSYLGLTKDQLEYIVSIKNSKWCGIDCKKRILITSREIKPL